MTTMTMRPVAYMFAALLVPAMAGCSAPTVPAAAPAAATSSSSTSQSPTPTPAPSWLGEVESLTELRDAAVAAGYACPSWDHTNVIEKASESGSCSDSDVFSTYASEADRDEVVGFLQANDSPDLALLVGPNWIINGDGAPALEAKLGGTTVTAADAPPKPSFDATAADFEIDVKILKKKCFGSAGCNVTYRIVPKYVGASDLPDTGTIEVTYEVRGLEDGAAVNTFTIEAGEASYDSEETGQIETSKTKLTGKVTDVTYSAS